MKWSWFGRAAMAVMSALALGLSMTACGGGTIAYLWAVGTQYSQIVGYAVDDFTGNLTAIPNQPFSSNGTQPLDLVVRPGGRFVYVINQGIGYSSTSNGSGDSIAVFAVGGQGSLTFEQSYETQGYGHLWASFDSTGGYLFVLDKYSASGDGNGAITTFASDPTTGRLNLVQQTASTQPGQTAPTYLEVGKSPLRMFSTGGCLFTINSASQTLSTYSISSGQLGTVTTGAFTPNTTNMTSINGSAQTIFLTDNQGGGGQPGIIFTFSVGNGCALTAFAGGQKPNNPSAANPVNTLLSTSGKYVYVLNSGATNTSPTTRGSTLTGYNLQNDVLTEVIESPFASGAGPVCAVEDPTSKFLYVANNTDGTITGYRYEDTSGELSNLQRGSTFKTSTLGLTCMAISSVL